MGLLQWRDSLSCAVHETDNSIAWSIEALKGGCGNDVVFNQQSQDRIHALNGFLFDHIHLTSTNSGIIDTLHYSYKLEVRDLARKQISRDCGS